VVKASPVKTTSFTKKKKKKKKKMPHPHHHLCHQQQ